MRHARNRRSPPNREWPERFTAPLLVVTTLLVGTSSCAPAASEEDPALRENELVMRTLMSTWETADSETMLDLFWPDAVYDDFPNQTTYQGVDEIIGYLSAAHAWGDDVFMNVGRVHPSPTGAVAEWVFSAIQNRPLGTLMPEGTGREIVLNGVTIIEIEGGRIRRAADYADAVPMMLQLGGEIALPGGDTLRLDDGGG